MTEMIQETFDLPNRARAYRMVEERAREKILDVYLSPGRVLLAAAGPTKQLGVTLEGLR